MSSGYPYSHMPHIEIRAERQLDSSARMDGGKKKKKKRVPGSMEPEAWEYEGGTGGFPRTPDLIRWVDCPIE